MAYPYDREAISATLRARGLDAPLRYFAQIGSTNDEAKRLLAEGAPAWTVVVADEQTAGRGRMGRRWRAPPGAAVLMSVVLRPQVAPGRLSRLTMLGAVATLRALRRWFEPEAVSLKWPNDVRLRRRKVAGVLPEAIFTGDVCAGAVLGIGLNVNGDFSGDAELAHSAISMAMAGGAPFDRAEVLAELLAQLRAAYPTLDGEDGRDPLYEAWRGALAMLGRRVTVAAPEGALAGVAEDVDDEGALWLRKDDGARVRLLAGDVSLAVEDEA